MAEPFLGEIRLMSFNFPPKGWVLCNGQFLAININQALFSILGTTFGGNGQTTFALPNLQGQVPIHVGQGHTQGERGGQEAHTLVQSEMPAHNHQVNAINANATVGVPTGAYLAAANGLYQPPAADTTLAPSTVTNVGGSQPHENRQPFLTVSFCIALQGIFPTRQ